jgi:hypothetical protein
LTAAAWRFHRHQVESREDPAGVWAWDKETGAPKAREMPRAGADSYWGLRFAREALQLAPQDHDAQVAEQSLALEEAVARGGLGAFPAQAQPALRAALARGPRVLSDVLKTAIADGKTDLAASAATALAQATHRDELAATGRPHALALALDAPGRRAQMAVARALVALEPERPFPGASKVVPVLARFLLNQALPRAVVIDGNPTRGSQLAGFLRNLGYDSDLELTGDQGFLAAAESADVEIVLVSYDLFKEGWKLPDTLANLGTDGRTAGIPVFIYGPLNVEFHHPNLPHDYPGIKFLVQPVDAEMLRRELKELPSTSTAAERAGLAREAAALLAKIAATRKSPFLADLTAAEPELTGALGHAETSMPVAAALGTLPNPNAQRSLAAFVLDPSRATAERRQVIAPLSRSIQRFGPLVTAEQEAQLSRAIDGEDDPDMRADLLTVFRLLRRTPSAGTGRAPRPPVPAPGSPSAPAPATL